jgi:HD-like signal output (HDOD) protein
LQVANLLSQDVSLSASVLKTLNSSYFGLRRHVSDIRQAAILLGPVQLVSLVTTYELRQSLTGSACISLARFWDCALDVAKTGVLVARALDLRIPLEDLYAIGLFHDCGIAVLAMKYPDYQDVLIESNSNYEIPMTEIENRHYGVDHNIIGYTIADSWDLPDIICQSILQNHESDIWNTGSNDNLLQAIAVLKISENIADRLRHQCDNPDWGHHREGVYKILQIDNATYVKMEQDIQKELSSEVE